MANNAKFIDGGSMLVSARPTGAITVAWAGGTSSVPFLAYVSATGGKKVLGVVPQKIMGVPTSGISKVLGA